MNASKALVTAIGFILIQITVIIIDKLLKNILPENILYNFTYTWYTSIPIIPGTPYETIKVVLAIIATNKYMHKATKNLWISVLCGAVSGLLISAPLAGPIEPVFIAKLYGIYIIMTIVYIMIGVAVLSKKENS